MLSHRFFDCFRGIVWRIIRGRWTFGEITEVAAVHWIRKATVAEITEIKKIKKIKNKANSEPVLALFYFIFFYFISVISATVGFLLPFWYEWNRIVTEVHHFPADFWPILFKNSVLKLCKIMSNFIFVLRAIKNKEWFSISVSSLCLEFAEMPWVSCITDHRWQRSLQTVHFRCNPCNWLLLPGNFMSKMV